MAQQDAQEPPAGLTASPLFQRFYRPPLIGLFAFLVTLLANPVFHSLGVAAKQLFDPSLGGYVHLAIGALGLVLLFIGLKRNSEVLGTLLGFAAGLLVWLGWASYSFHYHPESLGLGMVEVTSTQSRPGSLLFLQSSFGICIATLLFFVFNKDTKCDAFRWIQRVLRLNLGKAASGQGRNWCRITFMETIYVIWFCYGLSLFLGDQRFLGYQHPVTYATGVLLAVWSLYLLWKLSRFTRIMAAIRFAIPTKAIFWIPFGEFGPRYGFYKEVWLHPLEYSATMWAVFLFFLVLICLAAALPQRKQRAPGKGGASAIASRGEA